MPTINCSSEMKKYHDNEVTLKKDDQDAMRSRRDSGRTRLKKGLERDGHPLPKEIESQGSYAMRTMVEDSECDYDIDDGTYFTKGDLKDVYGNELAPYDARVRICGALKQDDRLKHDAEIRRNCVRQKYPEGYHIDIPVYRIVTSKNSMGEEITDYELASENSWTKSDARAVTRWFNKLVGELNSGEDDGSQMRRITKLMKKFSRSRQKWKDKTTSGIVITKLVTESFVAKSNRDDESLLETWKAISIRLNNSPRINHPVFRDKTLSDHGDPKVAFLRDCLKDALIVLQVLHDVNATKAEALKAWDEVFNTGFFHKQLEEVEAKSENEAAKSLLRPAAAATGLSFPNKPILPPNKPAGFA